MQGRIDGAEVYLDDGQLPAFTLSVNSLTDPSKVQGTRSTTMRVISTPESRRALGSEHGAAARPSVRPILRIGEGDADVFRAEVVPVKHTRDVIECLAVSGNASWFEYAKDVKRRAADLGESEVVDAAMQQATWADEMGLLYFPLVQFGGLTVLVASFGGVLIFGIVGFFFLDRRDFNIDFTLRGSVTNTLKVFFLFGQDGLVAHTHFAKEFIMLLRVAFACAITYGLYALWRPWAADDRTDIEEHERAKAMLDKWGDSPLDRFKVAPDGQLFLPEDCEGFVSYRTAKGYAIALGMPTAPNDRERERVVRSFDGHCRENNLRPVYYRVGAADAQRLKAMGKKTLPIGQEAVLDLGTFNLAGKGQKTLRNSLSRAEREGLVLVHYPPPVADGVLQKLKSVSAEWLATGKREAGFSQGVFDEVQLRQDTILTVENAGGRVLAFTNIIPDGVPGEATYDLLRTVSDAPGYVTDFLMVKLFEHFKAQGYTHVNLGLVPMSGITQAKDLPERALKFAYERIARFSHYKGLRSFKEKFGPEWSDKFLAYEHDLDLFFIPAALQEVEEP